MRMCMPTEPARQEGVPAGRAEGLLDVGPAKDGGAGGEGVERGSDGAEAAHIAEVVDDDQEHVGPRCTATDKPQGEQTPQIRWDTHSFPPN